MPVDNLKTEFKSPSAFRGSSVFLAHSRVMLGIVLAAFLIFSLPRFFHAWLPMHDSAIYILSGKGLHLPYGDRPDPYRGLLPYVVVTLAELSPERWLLYGRLLSLILSAASIFIIDAILRKLHTSPPMRFLILLLTFCNPYIITYATEISQEVYFNFFGWLTILLLMDCERKDFRGYAYLIPMLLSYYFRKPAIFMMIPLCFWLFFIRQYQKGMLTTLIVLASAFFPPSPPQGAGFFEFSFERFRSYSALQFTDTLPWLLGAWVNESRHMAHLTWPPFLRKIWVILFFTGWVPVLWGFLKDRVAKGALFSPACDRLVKFTFLFIFLFAFHFLIFCFYAYTHYRYFIFFIPLLWMAFSSSLSFISAPCIPVRPVIQKLFKGLQSLPVLSCGLVLVSAVHTAFIGPVYISWMSQNEQTHPYLPASLESARFMNALPIRMDSQIYADKEAGDDLSFEALFYEHYSPLSEKLLDSPGDLASNLPHGKNAVLLWLRETSPLIETIEGRPDFYTLIYTTKAKPSMRVYRADPLVPRPPEARSPE